MESVEQQNNYEAKGDYYRLVETIIATTKESIPKLREFLQQSKQKLTRDEYENAVKEGVNRSLIEWSADSHLNPNGDFGIKDQINVIKDIERETGMDHTLILEGVKGALNFHMKRGAMPSNDAHDSSKLIAEQFDLLDYWKTQWETEE